LEEITGERGIFDDIESNIKGTFELKQDDPTELAWREDLQRWNKRAVWRFSDILDQFEDLGAA
jgi:hypothetical protein